MAAKPALALAALLFIAATAAHAQMQTFEIDPRHTFPVFEVSHYGYSTQRGRFDSVTGQIKLDVAGRSGSMEILIDAASIDMGFADWNEQMKSEQFFNVAKYRQITFRSSELSYTGDKLTSVRGELTLLGITRPVTLTVTNFSCGVSKFSKKKLCGADATTQIQRSQFGMKHLLPGIGDQIRILIPIEATLR